MKELERVYKELSLKIIKLKMEKFTMDKRISIPSALISDDDKRKILYCERDILSCEFMQEIKYLTAIKLCIKEIRIIENASKISHVEPDFNKLLKLVYDAIKYITNRYSSVYVYFDQTLKSLNACLPNTKENLNDSFIKIIAATIYFQTMPDIDVSKVNLLKDTTDEEFKRVASPVLENEEFKEYVKNKNKKKQK